MIDELKALSAALDADDESVHSLLADTGYFSEANVDACAAARIEPLIATRREHHHPPLLARFTEPTDPPPADATPLHAMKHRLATIDGRKRYAKRKHTVEPVFGIIKSVLGFRQFLLRGLKQTRGEWNLVALAWNCKRMFALQAC